MYYLFRVFPKIHICGSQGASSKGSQDLKIISKSKELDIIIETAVNLAVRKYETVRQVLHFHQHSPRRKRVWEINDYNPLARVYKK